MTRFSSLAVRVLLLALPVVAGGCERGCASRWIAARKEGVTTVPSAFAPAIDCPDGLARCVGGVVEASQLARIPMPCTKAEGRNQCACPWTAVGDCPHGCLAEGVEVVVTADRAMTLLCVDPMNPRDAASLDDEGEEKDAGR